MAFAIQIGALVLWFPLAILVISAILRVGLRRYPLFFAYMVVLFLSVFAQLPAALNYHRSGHVQRDYLQKLHAISQGLTDPLIFGVVIVLIMHATANSRVRHLVRSGLAIGAPLFVVISLAVHYDRSADSIGMWLTPWNRDLNFCAAILDLILWALLLASRDKDNRLLLLVGGLGISFAGSAIANAIRSLAIHYRSAPVWFSAGIIAALSDAASLYIWWQAFRREAQANELPVADRKAVVSG